MKRAQVLAIAKAHQAELQNVDYLDVSDHSCLYEKVIPWRDLVVKLGITAISNSMVEQGVEQFDQPQKIKLSYVVVGSGGA